MRRLALRLAIAVFALTCTPRAASARDLSADPTTYASLLPTLTPGDTLHLAAGTYTQALNVTNLNGTPAAWITITGPASGPPAIFQGNACFNIVEIQGSSFVAIEDLVIDGLDIPGSFGISAKGGTANVVHDILLQGNTLQHLGGGDQQTDGVSTKTPTWGWIIRGNRILSAGTGLYLGNSDGSDPFIAGLIEDNLVTNTVGYGMEIKYQTPWPTVAGMPTGPTVTIVRDNVFIKSDAPSPCGDRPNLLIDGGPDSGAGAMSRYEIYGNFLDHNPRESLFQGSGRLSLHDNVFADVVGTALYLTDHVSPLETAYVYNNTIYAAGKGISFANAASLDDAVVGNLVFAATPLAGPIKDSRDNLSDTVANAAMYVTSPSLALGTIDLYPRTGGRCQGTPLDLGKFTADTDYSRDFNGTSKGTFAFRGAYAGEGTNPGWMLGSGIKGGASSTPGDAGASGDAGHAGDGGIGRRDGRAATDAIRGGDGHARGGCSCGVAGKAPVPGNGAFGLALAALAWLLARRVSSERRRGLRRSPRSSSRAPTNGRSRPADSAG